MEGILKLGILYCISHSGYTKTKILSPNSYFYSYIHMSIILTSNRSSTWSCFEIRTQMKSQY